MLEFLKWRRLRRAALSIAIPLVVLACCAVITGAQITASLATSDIRIALSAGESAPKLTSLSNPHGIPWQNEQQEQLPARAEVNGTWIPVTWRLRQDLSRVDSHRVVFVYESAQPHLRLRWQWQARAGFGPLEHSISLENLSGRELWLPMLDSLRLAWRAPAGEQLRNLYVEKGAGKPTDQGTHLDNLDVGYQWTGKSSTYAREIPGQPREIIPIEVVFTAPAQDGWYAGIEFSGRTRIELRRSSDHLDTVLGLNPEPGPYRTRLLPGETFATPTVFLGAFSGGPDGAGNQLRPWVRTVLGNPLTWNNPDYPLTVNNSWGNGMTVDQTVALRMITEAHELGLEMFHLDAGWFRGVGDWYPDPKKFPNGLAPIADAAHKQGLRFGLWVDWTQAGLDTAPGALNVRNPEVSDWLVAPVGPAWKPEEFKGQTVDIGDPPAHAWCAKEVTRIVDSYHLDMLEHDGYVVADGCVHTDHPHAPPDTGTVKIDREWGGDFVDASNSTDVSYHAVRAYYSIYDNLRREHPGLLLEICNDGGRMVDFGSAAHGDYFSITDSYDPLSNRRAFYDASHVLPAAMLESYEQKWPTPTLDNFLYMLRSGMMGWVTIMMDTSAWTPEQHRAARQAIALYKRELRPLIRDARLYHVSDRPDGVHWDGAEYWDPARGKGVLYAFRGSIANESAHRFVLAGLTADRQYRLHFEDGTAPDRVALGSELMREGVEVRLKNPLSSELVFLEVAAGQEEKR